MEILLAIANIFGMLFMVVIISIAARDASDEHYVARKVKGYEVLKSEESNN